MATSSVDQPAHGSPLPTANATGPVRIVPNNLLEAFIPQYGLISAILPDLLGIDIGVVLTGVFILYGLLTVGQYLFALGWHLISSKYMSFILVEEYDDIYDHLMEWLKEHKITNNNHRLTASTHYREPEDDSVDTPDGEYLNFSRWWVSNDPLYKPAHGSHWFRHKGRYFELHRARREIESTTIYGSSRCREEESVTISCLGRSAEPIKGLLRECKEKYYTKEVNLTEILRPQGSAGNKDWDHVARRRSRPMDTVILDQKEKDKLLQDINEFLHPKTAKWYSDRGIPYRRGYLFHGPPGTGKSSLSFAIAGLFGLDVYCISLLDPTMTEDDLLKLMSDLPSRCVVLLEDIDTAGLAKRKLDAKSKSKPSKSKKGADNDDHSDGETEEKSKRKGISLSGLLNAIDGVASHEGRALILTSNCPEKLDDALIRPGRVDMKIGFTLASRSQIRDLFLRMYAGHEDVVDGRLANKFAEQLEESTWSPAELQGYLLRWKKEPSRAVEESGTWAREEREKKKKPEDKDSKSGELASKGDESRPWIVRQTLTFLM